MVTKLRPYVPIAVIWLIWLACLLAAYWLAVIPQQRLLERCQVEISQKAERRDFLQRAKSPEAQERTREELEALEQKNGDFLFHTDDLNTLDFRVHELASSKRLTDFSGQNVTSGLDGRVLALKHVAQRELLVSFRCNFPDFVRFVNELERHQPILLVNQFTLKRVSDVDEKLSGEMELAVFYEK